MRRVIDEQALPAESLTRYFDIEWNVGLLAVLAAARDCHPCLGAKELPSEPSVLVDVVTGPGQPKLACGMRTTGGLQGVGRGQLLAPTQDRCATPCAAGCVGLFALIFGRVDSSQRADPTRLPRTSPCRLTSGTWRRCVAVSRDRREFLPLEGPEQLLLRELERHPVWMWSATNPWLGRHSATRSAWASPDSTSSHASILVPNAATVRLAEPTIAIEWSTRTTWKILGW